MGSTDVEVSLRDDAHAEVVESTGQETGEGRREGDSSVATRKSDANLEFENGAVLDQAFRLVNKHFFKCGKLFIINR